MGETITMTIRNGGMTVATEGYKGSACQDATRELEKLVGKTESDTTTPEFHEVAVLPIRN